ncbi:MAG TPA: methenyltetrahydromethanopterin cyclohydrolase [Alphaproteobacteria bacterium]|nr:methenyltetrahydromethanopterin cyclohydrolase [Alphaproteobacteria bacterium]
MRKKLPWPSINGLVAPLVAALVRDAEPLRLSVRRDESGATLVDAGIDVEGGIEAGRRIAEICLGGLGQVSLAAGAGAWPWQVTVHTSNPVLACLGSQYAGWSLKHDDPKFFALGSGPGRSLAVKEELFAELDYRDRCADAVFVLEVDKSPPAALLRRIAGDCGVAPDHLTVIMTPTQSLAGAVQIAARSLEVALHKAHSLKFPLDRIVDGLGTAALPPPSPDFVAAMGRTNDAILYGGTVQLFVTGPNEEARRLAETLPSNTSRDYGKPFAETFAAYKGDFYQIDPLLFSPGLVTVTAIDSGRSFRHGRHDPELLARSFALSGD